MTFRTGIASILWRGVERRRNVLLAVGGMLSLIGSSQSAHAQANVCTGAFIFCDDFNGTTIDTGKWTKRNGTVGPGQVRPGNLSLTTTADNNGTQITVVDVKMFGDQHTAAPRQGGILVSNAKFGAGRYEVRMKNLPDRNGCSCFWNYYDSQYDTNPPPVRKYTEIDIEMPAHLNPPPSWTDWRHRIGTNTYFGGDDDAHANYINPTVAANPFDAKFHIYRFDWQTTGSSRTVKFYMDGTLISTSTTQIPTDPAQIWVGAWPATWPGMLYDFDTKHMYIDWVKITALP